MEMHENGIASAPGSLSNGTVLSTKPSATGTKPAWNAALSKGWGSQPPAEWTPHRR